MSARIFLLIFLLIPILCLQAESFRTIIEDSVEVNPVIQSTAAASLGINSSLLINLGGEKRFLRGIEIEVSAPQAWLSYRGILAMSVYNKLTPQTASGITDFEGNRIAFEPLPAKIQNVYQIPLHPSHGLRTTPYVTVASGVVQIDTFPVLFRLSPIAKGITDELEAMVFSITVRPILTDEGAVRVIIRYPPQLRGKPFTILIDDQLIENIGEPQFMKEGEHHLVILSEDYRNESRRFVVEKAKILDLPVELQDTTPLIICEAPQNAQIFLNNNPIPRNREPVAVEPGQHEVKFQIGDYTVTKTINVQRGKTYRISLDIDLSINEEE